jgi:hypothetical protein
MTWEIYRRLESMPPYDDLEHGFAADVADPAWMLGRLPPWPAPGKTTHWQVGEHSGEDAGTAVVVRLEVAHTNLDNKDGLDPTVVPPEVIIEGNTEDWWTIGRRLRVGRAIAPSLTAAQRAQLPVGVLPDPYGDAFADEVYGRLAWQRG